MEKISREIYINSSMCSNRIALIEKEKLVEVEKELKSLNHTKEKFITNYNSISDFRSFYYQIIKKNKYAN